jgi:hypothetical protein
MTVPDSSRVIHCLGLCAPLAISAAILFAGAHPAHAFCVENGTDTRLLFTARLKSKAADGLIFTQWVDAGKKSCGTPESGKDILEVFVFAGEDSVEGCDDEIAAPGTLHLSKFEEFDNCNWRK